MCAMRVFCDSKYHLHSIIRERNTRVKEWLPTEERGNFRTTRLAIVKLPLHINASIRIHSGKYAVNPMQRRRADKLYEHQLLVLASIPFKDGERETYINLTLDLLRNKRCNTSSSNSSPSLAVIGKRISNDKY